MSSGTFYPVVGGDDGRWETGSFFGTASVLVLGSYTAKPQSVFLRFPSVNIPQGSTIDSAFVRLTAYGTDSDPTVNVDVHLNDIDNAIAPTDEAEADALVLTTNLSNWILGGWIDGMQYDSPSLISPVGEVISRPGWSSGNALQVVIKDNGSSSSIYRFPSAIEFSSGTEKAELHVTWTEISLEGEISENVNVNSEIDSNWIDVDENINVNSEFVFLGPDGIDEEISVNTELIAEYTDILSEAASVSSEILGEYTAEISEATSVNSEIIATHLFSKTIQETLSAWEVLGWGWAKTIADSLDIAETVEKILGIPVKDWLTITDAEITNWSGTEAISDSFYAVDISKVIKVYYDLLADGMDVADAVNLALELIITDILTCVDTALNIGTFQHSLEDGMTLADIAKRAFPKSISDSFAATDTSLVDFLALLQIADSFNAADTADRLVTINQAIADSLDALDTVAIKQLLQELIQDGLNIEVSVVIDGEIWETWVLNTGSFHPSVYSGYDYNSFCVFNNTIYGARSDGIYELEGDTDDGIAFHSGVILPNTQFGSANQKRFRKAFLGVSGDDLVMKLDTDNGSRTYKMVDTEISLTRDLKGRKWQISLEDFDELDFVELTPVILSRK